MKFFSQIAAAWRNHVLGWGPALGTIGAYGCFDTVLAMIANATGHLTDPARLDELFTTKRIFVRDPTGTYDLLPDNALDRAFPGRFSTTSKPGFDATGITAAIPSPDTYAVAQVHGYSPLWKMNVATHFVLMYSAGPTWRIVDPEGGMIRTLADYGGPAAVEQTIFVKSLPDPAQAAAAAAAAKAAAEAKAAASAAAAKAAQDATAAAAAAQAAAQLAAAEKAAKDAQAALEAYLADQAAKAKAASNACPVPTPLPANLGLFAAIQDFLIAVGRLILQLRGGK